MLLRVKEKLKDIIDLEVFSARLLEEGKQEFDDLFKAIEEADLLFFYRSSSENIWEDLEQRAKIANKPTVWASYDPTFWTLSTVGAEIPARCYSYITQGGIENFCQMLLMIAAEVLGMKVTYSEPLRYPWEGIYHPDSPSVFLTLEDYLTWYRQHKSVNVEDAPKIGILFARSYWVNENTRVEDALIRTFERKGLMVIPVFCYSLKDSGLGTKSAGEVVREYFFRGGKPFINALVKLMSFLLESRKGEEDKRQTASKGVFLLKELNVPVFEPVVSYYKTIEEWKEDPQGLNMDISWTIALPEFEGVIEPIFIGGIERKEGIEKRVPVEERIKKVVDRIHKWVMLQLKPVHEKKVAFILHNNPCASVEATVGGGANLDTLESVARIIKRMKENGYQVETVKDGKELIKLIMDRKAISEFRWTTVEEIVKKGGALKLMKVDEYRQWFDALSDKVKERVISSWGRPPGEEMNGVPAAMVYDGKIVITGIKLGNVYVCVQPKRGCAGSRCDGQVCKILHDPDVPPPHQYLATYKYLEEQVDVIVHVGTHGNLEFLPGKGIGLSGDCYPDMAIGTIPHLYIYNADNPPEGTIAKRRSYATLVDHMQTVMTQGGVYGKLEELDRYLEEYEKAKIADPARAHQLQHQIIDAIKEANLDKQIPLEESAESFEEIVKRSHEVLSILRNTQIQDGQHIFGEIPQGEKRVEFINSILRFDDGSGKSLRSIVARLMGLSLAEMLETPDRFSEKHGKSHGALLEEIDYFSKKFLHHLLEGREIDEDVAKEILGERLVCEEALKDLNFLLPRIKDLNERIEASLEIESLMKGFEGRYIPAGPSGLITRGRDDVLPTGRNFYSLDPYVVPTRAAYEVGKKLAEKVLEKYLKEEGRYPENIAIYWMSNDIMWADGEGLGQMLYLLGVKPVWFPNGRIKGVEVIPLEELGRPRIDLTVRVSGILRDNFPNCIELLDEAIQTVAMLDEPEEKNFVRKHALQRLKNTEKGEQDWRNATLRIFASKPGTYSAGVNLAVYASAWKDEKDLADVFLYWNGYAYGKGVFGKEAFKEFYESLKTVEVTYNKVVSDEHDLFGCCCYFGTHGGMTAAAKAISGKEVKCYYGDTREPQRVEVRTLADEVRRVVRAKLLNPKWIEGQKRHGYKGASDISKRIGRVYGWEATTEQVDDWIFDEIAKTFVLDRENREFFKENNPWALEEIMRRLIEAERRGLWKADPRVLEKLKEIYLETEGWLEEDMGEHEGTFQGSSIDVFTPEEIDGWREKIEEMKKKLC
nr:cobaltochelatase subunit CobN [Caldanaerobacter subterraneus]